MENRSLVSNCIEDGYFKKYQILINTNHQEICLTDFSNLMLQENIHARAHTSSGLSSMLRMKRTLSENSTERYMLKKEEVWK